MNGKNNKYMIFSHGNIEGNPSVVAIPTVGAAVQFKVWPVTHGLSRMACHVWPVTYGLSRMACHVWPVTQPAGQEEAWPRRLHGLW